ncbi:MAG: DUF4363 family protein [Clostridiales bacterium]|nr:DUF4363 family protein [Clostridiales bacterium]
MIRTIASIFITLGLIFGVSVWETKRVDKAFNELRATFETLQEKAELGTATYNDGVAARSFWDKKKETLHFWLPHTALQEIDFQLNEAIGFLSLDDNEGALPKIEVLIGLTDAIPHSYNFDVKNIF